MRVTERGVFHRLPQNSTEAERWAAYNGIWLAYHNGARDILVQTDCMSLVTGQHGKMARDMWPEANVRWKHVKGHNLHRVQDRRTWVNNWCDKNAKKEMKRQRARILNGV